MVRQRPGKVTAAAVIMFIWAVLGAGVSIFVIATAAQYRATDPSAWNQMIGLGMMGIAFAIVEAILGVMLWQGRQWARITTIAVLALSLASDIVISVITSDWSCSGWLLTILVIALLSSADARAYFAKPVEEAPATPFPY